MSTIIVNSLTALQSAISSVQPGDIVQIRGGIYKPTGQLKFTRAGVSGNPITWIAYPGELPIFDGSSFSGPSWEPPLIHLTTISWNIFEDIEVRNNHVGRGIYSAGSDCIFRRVISHGHAGSGFYHVIGSRMKWLYCSAFECQDPLDPSNGGNADGISVEGGIEHIIRGFISHHNSDDGIDVWQSQTDLIENSVSYSNGLFSGNGNGFKLGPGIAGVANHNVKKCIAYNNRSCGFTNNSGSGDIVEKCTAYGNGSRAFENYDRASTYRNNIAVGNISMGGGAVHDHNTWNLGITDPKFISADPTSADYLSLRSDSPCRGKASDGTDLGALQYGEKISDLLAAGYIFAPGTPVTAKFNNSLSMGGASCQQEFFVGPNSTTKTVSAGVQNFVADGVAKPYILPITLPVQPGIYKMFIEVKYQGNLVLEYVGLKTITII